MAAPKRLRAWIVGAALLALGLHVGNLLYLAVGQGCDPVWLTCPAGADAWRTEDTGSYDKVARRILRRGITEISMIRRTPGYPVLFALSRSLFGSIEPVRWLGPTLAAAIYSKPQSKALDRCRCRSSSAC